MRAFEPEVPSTLQAELRPYQVDGYRWLARLSRLRAGACLADDMGLGKTVQALAVLLDRAPRGPALVVAPTSVVANWVDEARRFAPTLNVRRYTGTVAERAGLLDDPAPFDLYLTTYGVMQNDIEQLGRGGLAQRGAGRGPGHQEPGDTARPGRPAAHRGFPRRHHGHADPEQPDGSSLPVQFPEPPACSARGRSSAQTSASPSSGTATRRRAPGCGASSPPSCCAA